MCARMRLISDVFKQLKEDDPDTNITMYALRTIVKSGKVSTIQLGRKTLINYDSLLDYLHNGDNKKASVNQTYDTIRRVG